MMMNDQDVCPRCGDLRYLPSGGGDVGDCDFCLTYFLISLPPASPEPERLDVFAGVDGILHRQRKELRHGYPIHKAS